MSSAGACKDGSLVGIFVVALSGRRTLVARSPPGRALSAWMLEPCRVVNGRRKVFDGRRTSLGVEGTPLGGINWDDWMNGELKTS